MEQPLRLLVEQPHYDINLLVEEQGPDKERKMFFEGVYMRAEVPNKNKRVYSREEMASEVKRYTEQMINTGRSIGETLHPQSVEVNPERACHLITSLRMEGNDVYGKSKILSTPMGQIIRTLMMDGVRLGVSSRALGKVEESNGVNKVSGFHLVCCDVVHDPSVDTAFVEGIYESKQYVLKCDGTICEFVEKAYDNLHDGLSTLPKHSAARTEQMAGAITEFINALKGL